MPTYERAPDSVNSLARVVMMTFEDHTPLLDAKVQIDYVFASGDVDNNGQKIGEAIKKNGVRCFGLTKKIALKERALGRGDVEILLDSDWWKEASIEEQKALLDHELHHISIKDGKRDDLGRPIVGLRKHDVEVGWFTLIASRHGQNSIERQQAKTIVDGFGQYFWPDLLEGKVVRLKESNG